MFFSIVWGTTDDLGVIIDVPEL
ncbi:hypothetical protein CGLO_13166 [Colletotrichum gloeosporioides Cg-14]|uniref:Uncharacterized protein n=1 Tax=Colletotrichum gloeosporioides (strain Cg-14) TaxID=1237896 RepID=T0L7Q9_COLGC|nr:hypothetical protein CGLO_13166 [Colletotrichum gloeosporioides Cg-14]